MYNNPDYKGGVEVKFDSTYYRYVTPSWGRCNENNFFHGATGGSTISGPKEATLLGGVEVTARRIERKPTSAPQLYEKADFSFNLRDEKGAAPATLGLVGGMLDFLQNNVPGLIVIRNADGVVGISLRGQTSLKETTLLFGGGNEGEEDISGFKQTDFKDSMPLFIVDGLAVSYDDFAALDLNGISRVDVLKGASAAMFGARSSNGAIVAYSFIGGPVSAKPQTYTFNLSGGYTVHY